MMSLIDAVRPGRPDFAFLTGWDACLVPMLGIGCDGGTNASSGVAPERTRALFDAAVAGDHDRAMQAQRSVSRIFDACFGSADFPEGFRIGAEVRGIAAGPGRMPMSEEMKAARASARGSLAALFAEEGLA
jgi:4-hydroxy-tetrahydrodipicolinate synthase